MATLCTRETYAQIVCVMIHRGPLDTLCPNCATANRRTRPSTQMPNIALSQHPRQAWLQPERKVGRHVASPCCICDPP